MMYGIELDGIRYKIDGVKAWPLAEASKIADALDTDGHEVVMITIIGGN